MLKMRNITKNFGAVKALQNADITVRDGEIMALLGSNGSGKSTMVKVLSGLVKPNQGEIFIDGKKQIIKDSAQARALGVGVVYQDLSLIPSLSVVDNIVLGNEPLTKRKRIDFEKASQIAKKYLAMLNLEDLNINKLVKDLMPSVQTLVEIAKILATKPKILVLDEATASLHSDEVDTLFALLKQLKETHKFSIIMVTHRMNEIYRICDRCTILKSGEKVAEGNIKDMQLDEIVFNMTGKQPDKENTCESEKFHVKNTENPMLNVNNLNMPPKLKGINFKAYKGEIIGIGGLEGQGEADFIHALLGDRKYENGVINYKGKEIHYRNTAEAIADDIGFISGDRNTESIFPLRSVAENLYAGKATKGKLFSYLTPKEINKFAQAAIDEYGIVVGNITDPADSLSGGNQQKLVVGRWIPLSPSLLLLDDPTKGVDINSRYEIHAILKKCLEKGMSVIYVSSDNEELLDISDRIYIFYEGMIGAELIGEERTEEKMVAAMLGLNKDNYNKENCDGK